MFLEDALPFRLSYTYACIVYANLESFVGW